MNSTPPRPTPSRAGESATSPAQQSALEVVATVSGREVTTLSRDQNLVGDLGIDSPKALQMLLELEERLEIEITDEVAGALHTVGDVLDAVARSTGPSE